MGSELSRVLNRLARALNGTNHSIVISPPGTCEVRARTLGSRSFRGSLLTRAWLRRGNPLGSRSTPGIALK